MSRTQLCLMLAVALSGCDDRPAQWDAYITYQEGPERSEIIEGFKTYELCRAASLRRLEAEKALDEGYFECGYKCGYKSGYPQKVCKETRD